MNQTNMDEKSLRQSLHESEKRLDETVIGQLANARATAIAQENHWFKDYYERFMAGYRGLFSASLMACAVAAVIVLPTLEKSAMDESLYTDDTMAILMEDPEFYLWLDKTGMLVAER